MPTTPPTMKRAAPIFLAGLTLFARIAFTAEDGEKYTNRLIHEKSPYLLQHAHNPVDWYPWGKEAFDKAKKENKPIFLSVGYSTDRKSTRLNSSHRTISYAVFCLKKK